MDLQKIVEPVLSEFLERYGNIEGCAVRQDTDFLNESDVDSKCRTVIVGIGNHWAFLGIYKSSLRVSLGKYVWRKGFRQLKVRGSNGAPKEMLIVPLADPECFDKVYNLVDRWIGRGKHKPTDEFTGWVLGNERTMPMFVWNKIRETGLDKQSIQKPLEESQIEKWLEESKALSV
jgi:hypothetical protein